ncbi:MAG: LPS translocon maturation chaperone LptM [Steroidobacter sp.]
MFSAYTKHLAPGLVALLISGCGLKGPLYLPDQPQQEPVAPASETTAPRKRRTAPNPAPQSQKEDAAESATAPSVPPPDPDRPADAQPVPPPGH